MNLIWDTIIKCITLIFVGASTFLAIRIYYRNKKIELENSLFKLRLEAIGNIQMEAIIFFQHLDRMQVYLDNPEYLVDKDLTEMSFQIDDQVYKCQSSIIKYAAYFSSETSEMLGRFTGNFLDHYDGVLEDLSSKLTGYKEFLLKDADAVVNLLRREAGIDQIHESLMERIMHAKKRKNYKAEKSL
jgi:hypothetical protein